MGTHTLHHDTMAGSMRNVVVVDVAVVGECLFFHNSMRMQDSEH